jgi:hypothetical protein
MISNHPLRYAMRFQGLSGMPVSEPDDTGASLADLEPTTRQTWWAVGVAMAALVAFMVVAPFAGQPLVQLNALFPSLDAFVFVTDLVTGNLAELGAATTHVSRSVHGLALSPDGRRLSRCTRCDAWVSSVLPTDQAAEME